MTAHDGEYSALAERVVAWHVERFPNAEMVHVALKGAEEMGEVASAILGWVGRNSATGKGDLAGEAADVAICLMVLLGRWLPGTDLMVEVEKKLQILTDPASGHRSALAHIDGQKAGPDA